MEKEIINKLKRSFHPAVLYIVFAIGVILYKIPESRWIAETLTPFMLLSAALICSLLVIDKTTGKDSIRYTLIWAVSVAGITFLAEVLGTNYGLIFGSYSYSNVLGFKLLSVPVIIALNWVMVTWGIFTLVSHYTKSLWAFILITSTVAVVFDWVMEPAAIQLNFWKWGGDVIPLNNYIAWFGLTAISAILWKFLEKKSQLVVDNILIHLLLAQFIFFILIRLVLL